MDGKKQQLAIQVGGSTSWNPKSFSGHFCSSQGSHVVSRLTWVRWWQRPCIPRRSARRGVSGLLGPASVEGRKRCARSHMGVSQNSGRYLIFRGNKKEDKHLMGFLAWRSKQMGGTQGWKLVVEARPTCSLFTILKVNGFEALI